MAEYRENINCICLVVEDHADQTLCDIIRHPAPYSVDFTSFQTRAAHRVQQGTGHSIRCLRPSCKYSGHSLPSLQSLLIDTRLLPYVRSGTSSLSVLPRATGRVRLCKGHGSSRAASKDRWGQPRAMVFRNIHFCLRRVQALAGACTKRRESRDAYWWTFRRRVCGYERRPRPHSVKVPAKARRQRARVRARAHPRLVLRHGGTLCGNPPDSEVHDEAPHQPSEICISNHSPNRSSTGAGAGHSHSSCKDVKECGSGFRAHRQEQAHQKGRHRPADVAMARTAIAAMTRTPWLADGDVATHQNSCDRSATVIPATIRQCLSTNPRRARRAAVFGSII